MTNQRPVSQPCYLRSRAACHAVVEEIVRTWGAGHHLVNCVAYFGSKDLDSTEEDWDMTMR